MRSNSLDALDPGEDDRPLDAAGGGQLEEGLHILFHEPDLLRDSLTHPDLSGVVGNGGGDDGLVLTELTGAQELYVPGKIPPERAAAIEETIWEKMHFAQHLRQQALGEFTIGTELHRSDSLGLVQLQIGRAHV